MGKKAFITNPKHQHYVSQCGEHDCSANNIKNKDYYEHLSLAYFIDEHKYKENDGKQSFSCKPKASRSRIPMLGTGLQCQ